VGTHRSTFSSKLQPNAALTYQTAVVDEGETRIAFAGDVDTTTSNVIVAAVTDALRPPGPRDLCVDLAGVRMMDSSGVDALMRCRARAIESGCRLAVADPQPIVHRVLEIAGMLELLAVTSTAAVDEPDENTDRNPDIAAAQACRRDAVEIRQAARLARERARAMMSDNDARQARMRVAWAARSGAGPADAR
jgi:anti-sigma B factor antagonist